MNLSILFTSGPIDNTNLNLNSVEIRIRNVDPTNSANVNVRLFNENSSPESLNQSISLTVNANSTESVLYSVASLSSFLIEVEVDLENRSNITAITSVQPTVTLFDIISNQFVQFVRLFVSSPELSQDVNYPVTPQVNLFLPEKINCKYKISGDVTINQVPQSGIDVSLTSDVAGVSFSPNPTTTDLNGEYVTTVTAVDPTVTQDAAIFATAQVSGSNSSTIGITEVVCGILLYVTGGTVVSVVDGTTRSIIDTITVFNADSVAIANSNEFNQLYVGYAGGTSEVTVIDTLTNSISTTLNIEDDDTRGIAVNTNTNQVYISFDNLGEITIFDEEQNVFITTFSVGTLPRGIAVNETTNKVYVASNNNITVIDGQTNAITNTLTPSGLLTNIAVSENINKVYVTSDGPDRVYILDGVTDNILETITGINISATSGVAVSENTNQVYFASDPNNIGVIDAISNVITDTISVGSSPAGIAVSETTDQVFVVNSGENTVSIIDATTNMIVGTISGFLDPFVLAISESC
ncbi:YncE family protein [Bacillus carboniphilus]|uniref:YncE family protein n=1 Tax=Bacillus carboniphilus TaxID=86663 RepID=A0ABY9JVJ4_9BACI|nr:YncE family protein [Bacillus carboniphilus]WLR42482.1 YncE family protein [Bacillus carboniphilus]